MTEHLPEQLDIEDAIRDARRKSPTQANSVSGISDKVPVSSWLANMKGQLAWVREYEDAELQMNETAKKYADALKDYH